MVTQNEILEYVKNSNKEVVKRSEITTEMKKRYPTTSGDNVRRMVCNRIKSLISWKELESVKKPNLYQEKYKRGELFYRIKKS